MTVANYILEFSWQGFSAVISVIAIVVALFGEKIRMWLYRPQIVLQEFTVAVPKARTDLTEKVVYEHYVEILHSGSPIEEARFEILRILSNANDPLKCRPIYPPGLLFPLQHGKTLITRDLVKIAEVSSHFDIPVFPINLGDSPWSNRDDNPHQRGRFFVRVTGKNFRSDVWPIDFVKDSKLVSGWRLEVQTPESEKVFFRNQRNYIKEFNEEKRHQRLP